MNQQDKMKAVLLTGHGGFDKLVYREDVEKPAISAGQALIRVRACGLNNTDINTRTAWYSKQVEEGITEAAVEGGYRESSDRDGSWGNGEIVFPRIQGADVCGIVEAVGDENDSELIGKRVLVDPWFLDPENPIDLSRAAYFGSEVDGGYAEYAAAPAANIYPIDCDYSDAELATIACAYSTAENLINRTGLGAGESIVISGASGGVGSAAIQLTKIRGARVIAISSESKRQSLLNLGADQVVDRHSKDLQADVITALGGKADVAVDVVGGEIFSVLVNCLRRGGRYSASGAISGPMVNFDLRKLIYRDLQFTGATVVPPGTFKKLVEYIESGKLKPVLAETYALKDLAKAQAAFMKKNFVGNIVVEV